MDIIVAGISGLHIELGCNLEEYKFGLEMYQQHLKEEFETLKIKFNNNGEITDIIIPHDKVLNYMLIVSDYYIYGGIMVDAIFRFNKSRIHDYSSSCRYIEKVNRFIRPFLDELYRDTRRHCKLIKNQGLLVSIDDLYTETNNPFILDYPVIKS